MIFVFVKDIFFSSKKWFIKYYWTAFLFLLLFPLTMLFSVKTLIYSNISLQNVVFSLTMPHDELSTILNSVPFSSIGINNFESLQLFSKIDGIEINKENAPQIKCNKNNLFYPFPLIIDGSNENRLFSFINFQKINSKKSHHKMTESGLVDKILAVKNTRFKLSLFRKERNLKIQIHNSLNEISLTKIFLNDSFKVHYNNVLLNGISDKDNDNFSLTQKNDEGVRAESWGNDYSLTLALPEKNINFINLLPRQGISVDSIKFCSYDEHYKIVSSFLEEFQLEYPIYPDAPSIGIKPYHFLEIDKMENFRIEKGHIVTGQNSEISLSISICGKADVIKLLCGDHERDLRLSIFDTLWYDNKLKKFYIVFGFAISGILTSGKLLQVILPRRKE